MGLIEGALNAVFGADRNVLRETAEVFRVNAEAEAQRAVTLQSEVLKQFAAEFERSHRSRFDIVIDGLNRIPRPAMALGTLGLFLSAMIDPVWFAARMGGIALVPEPLWWLLAAIVSFYFGARHQAKGQQFQRDIAAAMARAPQTIEALRRVDALRDVTPGTTVSGDAADTDPNPALADWQAQSRTG